jgi:acyl-CoA dehydrogenase
LHFDDCRVPAAYLWGGEYRGFLAIMEYFNQERVALIATALGMMKACLDDSIAWAQQRTTFGKPMIRHQVIRHKIADMSMRIDATEALLNQICWAVNEDAMPVAEISKAKVFATKALEFCASEGMQIMGGAGYLRGCRIERIYREVKVIAIGGGSEEIMRDLAVRQMGL